MPPMRQGGRSDIGNDVSGAYVVPSVPGVLKMSSRTLCGTIAPSAQHSATMCPFRVPDVRCFYSPCCVPNALGTPGSQVLSWCALRGPECFTSGDVFDSRRGIATQVSSAANGFVRQVKAAQVTLLGPHLEELVELRTAVCATSGPCSAWWSRHSSGLAHVDDEFVEADSWRSDLLTAFLDRAVHQNDP